MIRIAFLEYEKETKEIVFQLSKIFQSTDWTFQHFTKASLLAKAVKEKDFTMFVFDEMFKTSRFESVFVHDNPQALFLYVCKDPLEFQAQESRSRILYISKDHIVEDLEPIREIIYSFCCQVDTYALSYDGVHVDLLFDDIYYLEKIDKMVYFHTRKGVFHQRINMSDLAEIFEPHGFLRIHVSYLVNEKRITAWFADAVQINDEIEVPMSRSKKKEIWAKRKQRLPKY